MKIAVVVGETSGDILGADLLKSLKERYPNAEFVGIAGPLMQAEGMHSLAEMDKLSIMGFDGLRENLLDILKIRRQLINYLIDNPPDVFIGIDAPDFNLTVEEKLREAGIPVVHYVSPTVWAWRKYRIHKIRRAVDLMLTLFPFEKKFYQQHDVPAEFVGHPLAAEVYPRKMDLMYRGEFVVGKQNLIAVLPGSRTSEIKTLGPLFVEVMRELNEQDDMQFIIPTPTPKLRRLLQDYLETSDADFVHLVDGSESRRAMSASDMVLLASGTAALEAALLAKPMVVAYKISWLTYAFVKATTTVKHAAMPNHLLDEPIVPECMQLDATKKNIVKQIRRYMDDDGLREKTSQKLAEIQPQLAYDSSGLAVDAIEEMLSKKH